MNLADWKESILLYIPSCCLMGDLSVKCSNSLSGVSDTGWKLFCRAMIQLRTIKCLQELIT